MLICITTIILERILQAAILHTLGIIADRVTSEVALIRELLIFSALDILYTESGVGLIQELSKIPVQQFSYEKLTNAAFHHAIAQPINFHSTQDAAEVMKAIAQVEASSKVLEPVVIEFAPTLTDIIVACVIFYRKFNPTVAMGLLGTSVLYLAAEASSSRLTTNDRRKLTKAGD